MRAAEGEEEIGKDGKGWVEEGWGRRDCEGEVF